MPVICKAHCYISQQTNLLPFYFKVMLFHISKIRTNLMFLTFNTFRLNRNFNTVLAVIPGHSTGNLTLVTAPGWGILTILKGCGVIEQFISASCYFSCRKRRKKNVPYVIKNLFRCLASQYKSHCN